MAKLRISIVEFLNTAPLVWSFTDGPLAGKYDLSFTVPSQCAEALRRGDADIAIIPSIEYQRIDGVVALADMAIAAKREVRSLLVVSRKPIDRVRTMALDTGSRSTVALVRLLARHRWKIEPEFFDAAPDPAAMLERADAALVDDAGDAPRVLGELGARDGRERRGDGERGVGYGEPDGLGAHVEAQNPLAALQDLLQFGGVADRHDGCYFPLGPAESSVFCRSGAASGPGDFGVT